jgi:alcohol sulfotransferase
MSLRNIVRSIRRRWRDEPRLSVAAKRADAFLISYPKSGRTWLRYLLSCYFAELAELGFQPDLETMFRVLPNFDLDPVRGISVFAGETRRDRMPLVLVSHLTCKNGLFRDRPVILLVRDPRDVVVSAYFHATRHKKVFAGDIGAFLDDPTYGLPALTRFLNSWAEGLRGRRHLLISYEHMLGDPATTVAAVLDFLGAEIRDDAMYRAIEAAQFDRMRARERDQGIPGHDYDRSDTLSLRMRSGKAGGFAEWLDPGQSAWIIAQCRQRLTPDAHALLTATGFDLGEDVRGSDDPCPALLSPEQG